MQPLLSKCCNAEYSYAEEPSGYGEWKGRCSECHKLLSTVKRTPEPKHPSQKMVRRMMQRPLPEHEGLTKQEIRERVQAAKQATRLYKLRKLKGVPKESQCLWCRFKNLYKRWRQWLHSEWCKQRTVHTLSNEYKKEEEHLSFVAKLERRRFKDY